MFKYWAENKCGLKKQCSQLSSSMRRTGGGIADNLPTLSALDNFVLVAVMGGQEFARGDSSLAVNPFPELRTAVSPVAIDSSIVSNNEVMEMHFEQPVHVSPVPGTSHSEVIPETIIPETTPLPETITSRRIRRRQISTHRGDTITMERFATMAVQRVETELTTARAFAQLAEQVGNMARALSSVTDAITDLVRKMPDPSSS
ncbi:uncharacterized protein LOC124635871 [Helicoverpa zea]|uniref:uncharacterized protein LOC124635871 n=1 Tax=Helicoverpa zea TaxID=7113 RepID=UPI001F574728|nr:uncharacterized protein LOC124635871 [Helicoverpa zea]